MSNCPKCGYPIAPDEDVCANCGEPVENKNEENVSPEDAEVLNDGEEVKKEKEQEIDDVADTIEEDAAESNSVLEKEEVVEETVAEEAVDVSEEEQTSAKEEQNDIAEETIEEPQEEVSQEPAENSETLLPPESEALVDTAPEMPMMSTNVVPTVAPSTVEVPVVMPPEVPMTPNAPMMNSNMVGMPMTPTSEMPVAPEVPMMPSDNGILVQPSPIEVPQTSMPVTPNLDTSSEKKPSSKSSVFNKIMFFLVFIVSIVAIGLLSFFMMKIFSKDNVTQGVKVSENAREYHYEGFNLYIPEKDEKKDDVHAEVYDGDFYIGTNTWSAIITLQTGTYNSLLSNKSQLIDYFKDMGYETTEPTEKEISGVSFVKMEVVMGSKNVLVAYAKASGTKLYGIILENESGEYTDDDLKTIGTLLATAKYVGPKFSLPDGLQLDLFKETFMIAE